MNTQNNNRVIAENRSGATFSECRKYRYVLWRIWDEDKPKVMFVGLNPSTANENSDDPTIRRVKAMAKNWGYGGFYMMNLFAYVSAYPEKLQQTIDPIGLNNDAYLVLYGGRCKQIIFAWGNFKEAAERSKQVVDLFPEAYALQINKNGSPKHPLYVKGDIIPIPYKPQP